VTRIIRGEEALAEFRRGLTGRRGLELLHESDGRLLISLTVGVGKSDWMDKITEVALEQYGVVIVFCPTRRLINERRFVVSPPADRKVVNLRPRPSRSCGPERDAAWRRYEARGLAALGRAEICDRCPVRQRCYWPDQYGKALEGARVIYATQAQLTRAPGIIETLRHRAGAEESLTLLDEADVIARPARSVITRRDLRLFHEALEATTFDEEQLAKFNRRWLSLVETLLDASTTDLQDGNWLFPHVRAEWAVLVQRTGVERFGEDFHFPGFALNHLARSTIETRRRGEHGEIEFANRLIVGYVIIFSGTTDTDFARYRLGVDLACPFADHRFSHPGSRFFNLASSIGTRSHFPRNARQVLDFFALLVARRASVGKRVLLVAKKRLVALCATGMDERFSELGVDLRVQAGGWAPESLKDPRVIPLITYGWIGSNVFEDFDAVYCLGGYYVNESVVNECLQDLVRPDLQLPIMVETVGVPKRRRARVVDPDHRDYDVARLVQSALEVREASVVVQAVGRVRPFTRPREVITFQMGQLPGVTYDAEFTSLAAARRYFAIPAGRDRRNADRAARIAALRRAGYTQAETARRLGISERTVRTYERSRDRQFPL
jgi:hypothetical protein